MTILIFFVFLLLIAVFAFAISRTGLTYNQKKVAIIFLVIAAILFLITYFITLFEDGKV